MFTTINKNMAGQKPNLIAIFFIAGKDPQINF
jgi:hypothetical protein